MTAPTYVPEEWAVEKKLEHKGRGDLVGKVGHTDIKKWQLTLQHISDYHAQLAGCRAKQEAQTT